MPPALRDRLEIVQLSAYSPEEKAAIGVRHLWPKLLRRHGLGSGQEDYAVVSKLEEGVVQFVAENYTREAGVRQLERCLATLCRWIATKVALNREQKGSLSPTPTATKDKEGTNMLRFEVNIDLVEEILGAPKVSQQSYEHLCQRLETPGVAAGLAWTSSGHGTVQLVECCSIRSITGTSSNFNKKKKHLSVDFTGIAGATTGRMTLTGQLGEVLEESARIALTWVRSTCGQHCETILAAGNDDHDNADELKRVGEDLGLSVSPSSLYE